MKLGEYGEWSGISSVAVVGGGLHDLELARRVRARRVREIGPHFGIYGHVQREVHHVGLRARFERGPSLCCAQTYWGTRPAAAWDPPLRSRRNSQCRPSCCTRRRRTMQRRAASCDRVSAHAQCLASWARPREGHPWRLHPSAWSRPQNRARPAPMLRACRVPIFEPIGVVHSPFREKREAPRQGTANGSAEGTIELFSSSGMEHAVCDLEGFERLFLLFHFHEAKHFRPKVQPPRSSVRRGVLATRSPHRPNPIGLTVVRLWRVEGLRLHVGDLDVIDGTPVLDIKPYVPYADAFPDAPRRLARRRGARAQSTRRGRLTRRASSFARYSARVARSDRCVCHHIRTRGRARPRVARDARRRFAERARVGARARACAARVSADS